MRGKGAEMWSLALEIPHLVVGPKHKVCTLVGQARGERLEFP